MNPTYGRDMLKGLGHYIGGTGTIVVIDFADVDLGLRPRDFQKFLRKLDDAKKSTGTYEVDFTRSEDIGGRFGHITFRLTGSLHSDEKGWYFRGEISAKNDTFNFDPKPEGTREGWKENLTTIGRVAIPGKKYEIEFRGARSVNDEGDWR